MFAGRGAYERWAGREDGMSMIWGVFGGGYKAVIGCKAGKEHGIVDEGVVFVAGELT